MATAEDAQDMTLDPGDLNDTDEGILDMLAEGRCTPRYIAGELDLQQPYVNQRLKRLVEHDHVERIDRGLYELTDDPRSEGGTGDIEAAMAGGATDEGMDDEEVAAAADRHMEARSDDGNGDGLRAKMEAKLADLDVPGRPPEVEETRREAIKFAWETLREAGEMQPRELANETFHEFEDDPNLGYSAGGSRYDGYQLWDNCVREVLRELPGVHPGSGSGGWSFHEDDD